MKNYKLKQWYPSLSGKLKAGMTVEFNGLNSIRLVDGYAEYSWQIDRFELQNTDFWEEIKQPLFVTDDDIEILDDTTEIISVSIKHHTVSKWGYRYLSKPLDRENFKHFGIEANADKYIEENKPKPLFITDDGVEVYVDDFVVFVNSKLEKSTWRASIINNGWDFSKVKAFSRKSNADQYIWRNKRLFSYNDIEKYQSGGEGVFYDIKAIAKERISNE